MTPPPPFAVIFDMDGVLVDSEPLTIRAYLQAAAEFGVELDPEEYVRRVVADGMLIRSLFEAAGGDAADWDGVFRRKTEIYSRLVQEEVQVRPGARELLADLARSGIACALATSASRVTMDLVLEAHELAPCFRATVTLEDVANQKPAPDAFLKAAALLNISPDRCLVIEDASKGVVAAKTAGMACVAVPTTLSRPDDLSAADLVVESLERLTAEGLAVLVEGHC
jgi:HAD superfamily hydrolase (TIGR01509 family)